MASAQKRKKGSFEIGVNLRVTQCFDKGSRNYMEDFSKYYFEKDNTNNQSVVFAFFGVFDGHGGTEAAELAHRRLLDEIKSQEKFWSLNDQDVLESIREGFLRTHQKMVEEREKWPLTPSGFQSTAGTTASIAIIRNRKLYVGHVGDSAIVIGRCPPDSKDSATDNWTGNALTVEHKPDHPEERRRIEAHGGTVRRKAGIHRVVWNRPKPSARQEASPATPDAPESTPEYEEIPFLAVARSLGDLWSFDSETGQFHVSPEPDIAVYDLRPHEHRCVIIGSDGLWNVIKPETAVELVRLCERETEARVFADFAVSPNFFYHPAGTLVQFALERCAQRNVRSDNVTALVVMVDPPGKPMTQLRQERRRLFFSRLGLEEPPDGGPLPNQEGLVRRLLVESQRARGDSAGTAPAPAAEPEPEGANTSAGTAAAKVRLGPSATALRQALMGPSGFPSLVVSWSDACWRAMLSYCTEAKLCAPGNADVDGQRVLEHLMDMDVKYRKEALQAVPAVVSLKRAFTHDWEMTVCLQQLPLLSPEWTQLLVMCGASPPASPTSGSTGPTAPSLSPPASRRWIERRERILGLLYSMLGRRLPSELTKEARGYMRAHVAREVQQRMRVTRPAGRQDTREVPLLAAPEVAALIVKSEPSPPLASLTPTRTRSQLREATMNGRREEAPKAKPQLRRMPPASPEKAVESPKKALNGARPGAKRASVANGPAAQTAAVTRSQRPQSPDEPKAKTPKTVEPKPKSPKSPAGSKPKSPGSKVKSPSGQKPKSPTAVATRSRSPAASTTNQTTVTANSKPQTPGLRSQSPAFAGPKLQTPVSQSSDDVSLKSPTKTSSGPDSMSQTPVVSVLRSQSASVGPKSQTPATIGPGSKSQTPVISVLRSKVSSVGSKSQTLTTVSSGSKSQTQVITGLRSSTGLGSSGSSPTATGTKSQVPDSSSPDSKSQTQRISVLRSQSATSGAPKSQTPTPTGPGAMPQTPASNSPGAKSQTSVPLAPRTQSQTPSSLGPGAKPQSTTISSAPPCPSVPVADSGSNGPEARLALVIPPSRPANGSDAVRNDSPPFVPAGSMPLPFRSRKRPQSHLTVDSAEAEAEVNSLMRKLVVTFTPDPLQLKNFERRPPPSESPKPRPVVLPKAKEPKPRKSERKKKKKPAPPPVPAPVVISDQMPSRSFCKRVVVDANAEARLEEMMRSITARSTTSPELPLPARFLAAAKETEAKTEETVVAEEEEEREVEEEEEEEMPPKRRRVESEPDVGIGRRRLRLRTAKSDV